MHFGLLSVAAALLSPYHDLRSQDLSLLREHYLGAARDGATEPEDTSRLQRRADSGCVSSE